MLTSTRHILLLFVIIVAVCITLIYLKIEEFVINKQSSIDGIIYKVQEYNDPDTAADMLAQINITIDNISNHLSNNYPDDERVIRFNKRLKHTRLQETEHKPDESSYTLNKGELISFCLRKKNKDKTFHTLDTLMFVIIHELAHIMSVSEGHTKEFMDNFRFLLKESYKAGLYTPSNYKEKPITYCGVEVTHNPFYNH